MKKVLAFIFIVIINTGCQSESHKEAEEVMKNYMSMIDAQEKSKNLQKKNEILEIGLSKFEKIDSLVKLSNIHIEQRKFNKTINIGLSIIKSTEDLIEYTLNNQELGEYVNKYQDYGNKTLLNSYNTISNCYRELENYKKALEYVEKAIVMDENYPKSYVSRATIKSFLGLNHCDDLKIACSLDSIYCNYYSNYCN